MSENNTWQTVKQVLLTDEPLSAYNLTVNHNHTYFVSGKPNGKYQAFGVWVHNDCENTNKKTSNGNQRNIGSNRNTYTQTQAKSIALSKGYKEISAEGEKIFYNPKGNPKYLVRSTSSHRGEVFKGFKDKILQ